MMKNIETSSRPREKIIHPYIAIATFHGGLENFIKRCKEEGQTTFTLSKLEFGNLTFLLKVFTLEGREITQVNVGSLKSSQCCLTVKSLEIGMCCG